jgi:hypothetical protein
MHISFSSSVSDWVAFRTAYSKEIQSKILPGWIRVLLGVALWAIVAFVVYHIIYDVEQTLEIAMCVLITLWLWLKGVAFLNRKMMSRYFSSLPNAELCSCSLENGRFITENRGLIQSFPLSALSKISEYKDGVIFDFPDLGRARIPFSAFATKGERAEFILKVNELKTPNQSTDPTP